MRIALITGITGQDGSYLAELLLSKGYRVIGLVRPNGQQSYGRIEHLRKDLDLVPVSLLDEKGILRAIERYRPNEIYNFAARASSSQLFADPIATGDYNGLAVVRLLEAARTVNPAIRFCQASSSEMFGNTSQTPQTELTHFKPRNPYGAAKLFGHQTVGIYRSVYNIFACSGILFNHESPRRGLEFVTRKITAGVAQIKLGRQRGLRLGDLEAKRDWGYAPDYVRGMWQMLQAPVADDYIIATGQSHTVREFCEIAFNHVGLDYREHVETDPASARAPELVALIGDSAKIRTSLQWYQSVSFEQLVCMMVDADLGRLARGDFE